MFAERIGGGGSEARRQRLARASRGEDRAVEPGNRGIGAFKQRGQRGIAFGRDDFARRNSRDLLAHAVCAGNPGREKFSGRDVDRRQRETALAYGVRAQREQKTFFARSQHSLFAHRAGRDHTHDLTRHQAALRGQLKRRIRNRRGLKRRHDTPRARGSGWVCSQIATFRSALSSLAI